MRTSLAAWLRTRIRTPILGLDLDADRVQVLELEPGAQRVRVQATRTCSAEDPAEAATQLRQLIQRGGFRSRHVAIAMPAAQVQIRRLQLPGGLDDEGLHELLCADAARYLPHPLSESCFDFERLDAGAAPHSELRLYSCTRRDLEQRCAIPQAAGLQVVAVDLDRYALADGVASLQQAQEAVALLNLRKSHAELLLLDQGRIVHAQVLALPPDWLDPAQHQSGCGFADLLESLRAVIDPVLPAGAQLLLAGEHAASDELAKAFSQALARPCCAARDPHDPEPIALLAYGLALRAARSRA